VTRLSLSVYLSSRNLVDRTRQGASEVGGLRPLFADPEPRVNSVFPPWPAPPASSRLPRSGDGGHCRCRLRARPGRGGLV
jgi:hypothetical protein